MLSSIESLDKRTEIFGPIGLLPRLDTSYEGLKIQPRRDMPTVVRPADFQCGHVERGFYGEPADCLLLINAAGIAGDGPTTQACQVSEGLKLISNFTNPPIPIYYLGPQNGEADFAEADFTGRLPDNQIGVIPSGGNTIPEKFRVISESITDVLRKIVEQRHRKLFIVSTGYTAFVPYGVKQAMSVLEQEGIAGIKDVEVRLINQDSSFPDTDFPSKELDSRGYPLDRFYPPAYASTDRTEIWSLTNDWLKFNAKWARRRAPDGTLCAAATFPFTPEYVRKWANWRSVPKPEARKHLADLVKSEHPLYTQALRHENVITIALFASNDYFDHNSVSKWMTQEQFQDMITGSTTLVKAVKLLAERLDRPVLLSGVDGFVDMILAQNIEDVSELTSPNQLQEPKVILVRVPRFKQSLYGLYHRAADIGIHRTTQANAAAEGVIAGATQLYLTMPIHRYMDTGKMDRTLKVEGMRQYEPDVSPEKLAQRIIDILTITWEPASLQQTADNEFMRMWKNPGSNFMAVIAYLAGFPIK